jgi:hypothetical protein
MVFGLIRVSAQSTITYTVDNDFDTGQKFRSGGSVSDIVPLEDGGYFAAGSFQTMFTNPDSPFPYGGGMITASGGVHPDWEDGTVIAAIRELHDYQGGYIFSGEFGQAIVKMTYTGISWYATHGEYWADYFRPSNAAYTNPYNVAWGWDVYIQEDEKVLIAGAIATDTLQPNVYRHLTRVLPDGTHDESFPIIEATPVNPNSHISKIEKSSDGSWYVSGRFEGINGHYSPHIVKLSDDFEVDTEFVSPFIFESLNFSRHTELKFIDSQDRLWFGGTEIKLQSDPDEIFHLVRLLPNGEIDPDFTIGKINSDDWNFGFFQPPIVMRVFETENNDFFVLGSFSQYNDTSQFCITALDDNGSIQSNYFMGSGTDANSFNPDDETAINRPFLSEVIQVEDGSLLIGGAFSNFMGVEKYGVVKLNQGTVSTEDRARPDGSFKLYPNPAKDQITLELSNPRQLQVQSVVISDLSGRRVANYPLGNGRMDVSALASGMYLLHLVGNGGSIAATQRLVIK